jgi:hypothetical protein
MTKRQAKFGRRDVNGAGALCGTNAAARRTHSFAPQLRRRGFAVRKNFSYRRSKIINACARHDDPVTATVSFFSDAQESTALIFPELDIEMLALNL